MLPLITVEHLILIWDWCNSLYLTSVGGRWQLPRRMKGHRGMKNLHTQGAWAKLLSSQDCSGQNNLTAIFPCEPGNTVVNIEIGQMQSCTVLYYNFYYFLHLKLCNKKKIWQIKEKDKEGLLINLEGKKCLTTNDML